MIPTTIITTIVFRTTNGVFFNPTTTVIHQIVVELFHDYNAYFVFIRQFDDFLQRLADAIDLVSGQRSRLFLGQHCDELFCQPKGSSA